MRHARKASAARASILALAFLGASAGSPAFARQNAWRDLSGTVTDGHHEPLRGAVIQIRNEADDSVMSYITGRSGHFSFKRLDANTDYDLTATFQGHKSKTRELSHFESKPSKIINLTIHMQ